MSSILEALEKDSKSGTTEVVRPTQLAQSTTAPDIRAQLSRRRLLVLLLCVPVAGICVVAGLTVYRVAVGDDATPTVTLKQPVRVASVPTVKPEPASALEQERIDRMSRELANLKDTLEDLVARGSARPAPPPPVPFVAPRVTSPEVTRPAVAPIVPPQPERPAPEAPGPATVPTEAAVAEASGEVATAEATAPDATEASASAPETSVALSAPDIELDGIAAGPDGFYAIYQGQILEVGDTCGDWEITEIGDGYIRVQGWDRKIHLH